MKINEHNNMMAYLQRPGKVLANNINNKKIPNTEARTALKRGGSDTKVMPKKEKILEYIDDHNIVYGDKKATKADAEAAAKRIERRDTWKEFVASGGKELPKLSPEEIKKVQGDRRVRDYMLRDYKKVAAKIPVIPPKPDMVNGHSDWNQEDWLDSIDPSWWLPDDRKVEANSLYEKYLELLKGGELLPNTTFEMFEKNYLDFDTDVISKINKKVKENKRAEGIVSILGLSPDRI